MSNPSSNRHEQGPSRQDQYRPRSITELAAEANEGLWDPTKPLKHWLRTAEKARKDGNVYVEAQDYELGFIEYAKAATLVLEKLPNHKEYQSLLSPLQRKNLGMNGQEILDSLSELKPLLVDRYERWIAQGGSPDAPTRPRAAEILTRDEVIKRRRDQERAVQAQEAIQREVEWRMQDSARRQAEERERRVQEEAAWARQSHEVRQRELDEAKRLEAREAAEYERAAARRGYVYSDEERKEEEKRRRQLERRREEQEGILRRQQEADAAARAARREIATSTPTSDLLYRRSQEPETLPRGGYPDSSTGYRPSTPQGARPSSSSQGRSTFNGPYVLPLESPMKYEDDTDTDERSDDSHVVRRAQNADRVPLKAGSSNLSINYTTPITTTSPAPPDLGHVQYPTLMSQHQLKQGYTPSLRSMFLQPSTEQPSSSSLLLETKPSNSLYANILPKPPAPPPPHYLPGMPIADPFQPPREVQHGGSQRGPSPSSRPPLPAVPPPPTLPSSSRIVRGASTDSQLPELKPVKMPRDCLSRFLSIARVNTERNKETCGLLLGKEVKGRYIVSVLLIPKQHSTSDTCTMDEEELVLQITEQRKLITLGWIHTHPTQSCFMSSVDLHTHSGFQRMLPESFAVVCAPSSQPTFGIFRLTDPEGLQTILQCNAKEAFHPHPDVAIYTDCDSNHVQIKDIPIEIVDLR
ncbi:Mov34-domain-containing protein [Trametopsis cervina]|nr:Mov34-domain-containing protein [Trametopsis cervina]